MANLRNLSRELRRARARIRWLEAEGERLRRELRDAADLLGTWLYEMPGDEETHEWLHRNGAHDPLPEFWINRNSAHPAQNH